MVRTQIQLTEEQSKGLHEAARQMGISIAEFVRRAVDRALDSNEKALSRRRALNVIGCVSSSKGDLSVDHDKYLETAYAG